MLAIGKAASAMAAGAEAWLAQSGRQAAGGIVVAPASAHGARTRFHEITGDHPVPGANSRRAAEALEAAAAAAGPADVVWVLLSGGASSLVAAPVQGLSSSDLEALWLLLLASGLDIRAVNAVRRRFTRWGGGRLALALAGRAIEVLAVSDVPGDDPAAIGSGPCAADPLSVGDVERTLRDAALWDAVPSTVRAMLHGDPRPVATVGPAHPAFVRVRTRIVARNADAVRAAAVCAEALGWVVRTAAAPLTGPAADAGVRIANALLDEAADGARQPVCLIEGGETTVALGARSAGSGGRCQELALAAAAILAGRGAEPSAALLAAGTDGRDGPTDAAGAVVDGDTWRRVIHAGLDPAAALAGHDSYRALDAAGALLRSGPTGTNVMDLVIGSAVQG